MRVFKKLRAKVYAILVDSCITSPNCPVTCDEGRTLKKGRKRCLHRCGGTFKFVFVKDSITLSTIFHLTSKSVIITCKPPVAALFLPLPSLSLSSSSSSLKLVRLLAP